MSHITALTAIFLAFIAFEDAPNLLKPTNKVESWRFEQHEGGKGEIKVDGDAIKFTVKESDGTDWHVQAVQTDLDLKEGKEYTVKFKAKASTDRSVGVHAGIDQEDWHQIGLGDSAYLTKEFKDQSFTFTATGVVAKKNRIAIVLGLDKGDVWIKDMTLTEKK
jgi:hypothetical protein